MPRREMTDHGSGAWQSGWAAGLCGETLLEYLARTAFRDPERLESVRRLIDDLRSTDEGRRIVPDDLYEIWRIVYAAVDARAAEPGVVNQ